MFVTLAALALAAPTVEDALDAWYVKETYRGRLAVPYHLAEIEARPGDAGAVMGWLEAVAQDGSRNSAMVLHQVDEWARDQQDGPAVRAVRATARMVAAWPSGAIRPMFVPDDAGPWCDEALALLTDLPSGPPDDTYTAVWWRVELGAACGHDVEADRARLAALAGDPEVGVGRRTWFAVKDSVDAEDVDLLVATIRQEPWRLSGYRWLFGSDAWGAGVPEARQALRAAVDGLLVADRPATLHLAAGLLEADGEVERALAVRRQLRERDPGNRPNAAQLDLMENGLPTLEAFAALTVIDPAARLEALGRRPPRGGDAVAWWRSRAEAQQALGRDDDALVSLARLARLESGPSAELAFARAALTSGKRLRAAHRAADRAVRARMEQPIRDAGAGEAVDAWAERLSEALVVRARSGEARGRTQDAAADLVFAVRVAPDRGVPRVRLGLLYAASASRQAAARDLLATGLARGGVEEALAARAEAELARLLEATGTWAPAGVQGYVDGMRRALTEVELPADLERLPELSVTVDGEPRSLSSFEGPVVLELWATWCGPCKQALPHLDALARRYDGRVTFVALSVDEDDARAEAYLRQAGQGEAAFVSAWGGPDAQAILGVRGIPAAFVLDRQGGVVARTTGYGPGDRSLEQAVERMLGAP